LTFLRCLAEIIVISRWRGFGEAMRFFFPGGGLLTCAQGLGWESDEKHEEKEEFDGAKK